MMMMILKSHHPLRLQFYPRAPDQEVLVLRRRPPMFVWTDKIMKHSSVDMVYVVFTNKIV